MSGPVLSIIVPSKTADAPDLKRFLASVKRQSMPASDYEILVETRGNSEQAKAYAIQRARGDILGFFCADNVLVDRDFLRSMVWCTSQPWVTGAYPARYSHVEGDTALSRYFALLGANDPLCWWLGKADRYSYLEDPKFGLHKFPDRIPSLGDNGFFVKKSALAKVTINPDTHFPMDLCEDLRRAGEYTYFSCPTPIWHRTGESMLDYFHRRYRYARDLYFRQKSKRRWHMVDKADWGAVLAFSLMSLCGLPHVWTSLRGYRRVRDWAWFLHAPVCFVLTVLYAWAWVRWGLFGSPLSSAPSSAPSPLTVASRA